LLSGLTWYHKNIPWLTLLPPFPPLLAGSSESARRSLAFHPLATPGPAAAAVRFELFSNCVELFRFFFSSSTQPLEAARAGVGGQRSNATAAAAAALLLRIHCHLRLRAAERCGTTVVQYLCAGFALVETTNASA
jgi:hypothetical protein